MTFKNNWSAYQTGHPAAHNQIADRLNLTRWADDYASVQAAIDVGPGVVLLANKTYTTHPLVLPRNPSTSDLSSVRLVGSGPMTRLKGDVASFETGDSLISWAAVTARAFHQQVINMTLELPNVAGVRAIHYQPTAKSNSAEHGAERLQVHLENLRILAHNDYHEELIYLEGTINRSIIRNIEGDPAFGDGTYQTLLLHTDSDLFSDIGNDLVGFSATCVIDTLYSAVVRGGRGAAFRGRMNASIFRSAFGDGGLTPSFHFINCIQSRVENIYTEGRSEQPAMIVFEGCQRMTLDQFGLGTPDELYPGAGYGHGLMLTNTQRSVFRNRWIGPAKPVYSSATGNTKKLLVLDSDSTGNRISDFDVRVGVGGLGAEVEDNGTGNTIEVVEI